MKKGWRVQTKGFTVIELLVVVGVIISLLGIIFISIYTARAKAEDTRTREVLGNVRTAAIDEHTTTGTFTTICDSGKTYSIITALAGQLQLDSDDYTCLANENDFVVFFPLKAESGFWCIDAQGNTMKIESAINSAGTKNCLNGVAGGGGEDPVITNPSGNALPLVDAGPDKVLTVPQSSVTLSGTATDTDGTVVSTIWTMESGGSPSKADPVITNPNALITTVTGLTEGTYLFRLSVTDNQGAFNFDDTQVVVSSSQYNPAARTLTARWAIKVDKMFGQNMGFYESLPRGYNNDQQRKWPLLIFMHGAGESGNGTTDLSAVLRWGPGKYISQGNQLEYNSESFVVIMPQIYNTWHPYHIEAIIEYAKSNYNIDQNRIYLTGLSMGGWSSTIYPQMSMANANQIAAIAPTDGAIDGTGGIWTPDNGYVTGDPCNFIRSNIKIWLFQRESDPQYEWETQKFINAINNCPNLPSGLMKITTYPGVGHDAFFQAYDPGSSIQSPNMYEWLLMQRR